MAKEPNPSTGKSDYFLKVLNKYGIYLYLPARPVYSEAGPATNTITRWERLDREEGAFPADAWLIKRSEPSPFDYVSFHGLKN